jgi:integrase
MGEQMGKLNSIAITKAKEPGYYGDGGGLWLQIAKGGSKSWVFRFTLNSKRREMGLGPLHTIGLADARARALECRKLVLDDKDPIEHRKLAKARDGVTFDQCSAAYIEAHRSSWRNAKHAAQWEATLKTYASPMIGSLPVAAVDTAQVVRVLRPIWGTKTETASRLRGRIESVIGWATTSGYRAGDNPARWRGHLENLLAAPTKIAKVKHHSSLPWQEIGSLMSDLGDREGISARALEFLILTASRSGEVRLARWDEISDGLWTIPADRMKAGREHRVPLSRRAQNLLKELPRSSDYIFPGVRYDRPLSDMSLTAVLRRMDRNEITVHGFRSTFRMWTAEATTYPREVCEHALAHSLPDKVEAAYQRSDLFDKRAALMRDWADFIGCE